MDKTYERPGDGSDYVPPDPNQPVNTDIPGTDVDPCGARVKFSVGYTEVKITCLMLPHEEKIKHRAEGILTGTNGERISLVWG